MPPSLGKPDTGAHGASQGRKRFRSPGYRAVRAAGALSGSHITGYLIINVLTGCLRHILFIELLHGVIQLFLQSSVPLALVKSEGIQLLGI